MTRVEFFALDSTISIAQLRWLDERLAKSDAEWKVCFFHHPLYTSGAIAAGRGVPPDPRTAADQAWRGRRVFGTRAHLSAIRVAGRHSVVRSAVGAGSLRPGDGTPASYVARNYDSDYHFMLIEIDSDELPRRSLAPAGRSTPERCIRTGETPRAHARGQTSATRRDTAAPR